MAFVKFTREEFEDRFGIDLESVIHDDNEANKVERAIDDVTEQIQEYIIGEMGYYDFDNISINQQTYINRACMEQLKYRLTNGDLSRESGIDAFNQTMVDYSQLRTRVIAPRAKSILNNHIITKGY